MEPDCDVKQEDLDEFSQAALVPMLTDQEQVALEEEHIITSPCVPLPSPCKFIPSSQAWDDIDDTQSIKTEILDVDVAGNMCTSVNMTMETADSYDMHTKNVIKIENDGSDGENCLITTSVMPGYNQWKEEDTNETSDCIGNQDIDSAAEKGLVVKAETREICDVITVHHKPSEQNEVACTSSKPHKCDSLYSIKGKLVDHMLTHTGEKPLKCRCDICDFPCSDLSSLKRHKQRHAEEKAYKCNQCKFSCFRQSDLTKHMYKLNHLRTAPENVNLQV